MGKKGGSFWSSSQLADDFNVQQSSQPSFRRFEAAPQGLNHDLERDSVCNMSEPAFKGATTTSEQGLPRNTANEQTLPEVSNGPARSSQEGAINDEKTSAYQDTLPKVLTPARTPQGGDENTENAEDAVLSIEEEALLLRQCRLCKVSIADFNCDLAIMRGLTSIFTG